MSKSLGNVIDPVELVNKYGADPIRYFLLGGLPSYDDGDYTNERFEEFYSSHLANGIGNLTSRILTMLEKYSDSKVPKISDFRFSISDFWDKYEAHLEDYLFDHIVQDINELVSYCDTLISSEKPWEKAKAGVDISALLYQLAECLRHLGLALLPIIPETGEKILHSLGIDVNDLTELKEEKKWGGLSEGGIIKKGEILFPRLEK